MNMWGPPSQNRPNRDKKPRDFTKSYVTKKSFFGGEKYYDSKGREIKAPDAKSEKLKKAGWW